MVDVYAERTNTQVVYGLLAPGWVETAADADSAGVQDVCGLCPAAAAALASLDGCP